MHALTRVVLPARDGGGVITYVPNTDIKEAVTSVTETVRPGRIGMTFRHAVADSLPGQENL